MINALTVDVEEYFHPSEVQLSTPQAAWTSLPSRVADQVYRILDLFDARGVTATFFVVAWVAERNPGMVKRITARGHEIGCHSYAHQLVYDLSPQAFREDTRTAVSVIEDICGVHPTSYRAPSFSIMEKSWWALEILVECGFTHDSSIYPIHHDRYGVPGFHRHATVLSTPSGPIQEIPVATVKLDFDVVAPVGGGGYLRLLPYRYTAAGIRRVNGSEGQPVCIYFHPWEIDPKSPRLASGLISRLRTYHGVAKMERKIAHLVSDFQFSTLASVYPLPGRSQEIASSIVDNEQHAALVHASSGEFLNSAKFRAVGTGA